LLRGKGIQAKTVAETIGISETQVSLFGSGKLRGLRFSTLSELCFVVECEPSDLLGYDRHESDLASDILPD
jgi:putative transcriptional regulator